MEAVVRDLGSGAALAVAAMQAALWPWPRPPRTCSGRTFQSPSASPTFLSATTSTPAGQRSAKHQTALHHAQMPPGSLLHPVVHGRALQARHLRSPRPHDPRAQAERGQILFNLTYRQDAGICSSLRQSSGTLSLNTFPLAASCRSFASKGGDPMIVVFAVEFVARLDESMI